MQFLRNANGGGFGRGRSRPEPCSATFRAMANHVDRYVPAQTNGGWGVASGVILLAVICIATATYVHKQTYRHPTDPTWHGKGSGDGAPAATTGAEHER